jgi:hypothetical protein
LDLLKANGRFQVDLSDEVRDFFAYLENGARFRYYELSYHGNELGLSTLDRSVWELRRYCQALDYDLTIDGLPVNQLDANLERVRTALERTDPGSCLSDGWLERILDSETHPARSAIVWKNLFFGTRRRKSMRLQQHSEIGYSPLDLHPEILDEASKYVYIPKEVQDHYRKPTNARRPVAPK